MEQEKKKKLVIRTLLSCVIGAFIPLSCSMFTFAWFISTTKAENKTIKGEVGLRDYFYADGIWDGDGTSTTKPHEIVTPTHFYNLTRLQNLGVFSDKTYFQIGHDFNWNSSDPNADHTRYCLDENGNRVSVLDMTDYCLDKSLGGVYGALLPIGSEGTPFNGYFDGSLIPIIGLRVAGNPEDVGVFGYTSHTSDVKNIVFEDLEVTSLGYSTTGDSNFLYSEIIETIFNPKEGNPFESASLDLDEVNLKSINSTTKDNIVTYLSSNDGIFTAHFPTITGKNIEYSISSSTGVIKAVRGTDNQLQIDLTKLPSEFSANQSVRMNSNISLVASVKIDGIKYSRVIQSYNVEFKKAPSDPEDPTSEKILSMTVTCNHTNDSADNPINFAHGFNVGYIVGHADGNVDHCYVYNGTLVLNKDIVSLHKIPSQTETGLIGRIGNNVTTDIDPTNTTATNGETGVLNLSYIYSLIRTPFVGGVDEDDDDCEEVYAGYQNTWNDTASALSGKQKTFITYAVDGTDSASGKLYGPHGTAAENFEMYKEYLRTDTANPKHFITYAGDSGNAAQDLKDRVADGGSWYLDDYKVKSNLINKEMNSVDFTWNKVISDTDDVKRGLGVFKIVTARSDLPGRPREAFPDEDNIDSQIWRNDIGGFSIIDDASSPKTAIYYSTAECDWTKEESGYPGWSNTLAPASMNTLPEYSDTGSFEYPFSRDFNYMFKIGLSEIEARKFIVGTDMKNYMFNTTSGFLKNYLQSILINRRGEPVEPGTKGFGFKVQFSQDSLRPVDKLTSYISVGKPTSIQSYPDGNYYPEKSIVFSISNPKGANVSIAGCDGNISIYRYDPESNSPAEELYTMYSKSITDANYGRAFEYQHDAFNPSEEDVSKQYNTMNIVSELGGGMSRAGWLYGHTFKVPYGTYVIAASTRTYTADPKIYYVCVQGQTNGDLGEMEVATIGNYIHDVDFLLKRPTAYYDAEQEITPTPTDDIRSVFDVDDETYFAKFSFNGDFTNAVGKMVVDTIDVSSKNYIRCRFNDFITYLLFYCRRNNPAYKINNENSGNLIVGEATYDGPYENFTTW